MAITIVDTAPIVSSAVRNDPMRTAAQQALLRTRDDLVVSAPITQEVDYLLGKFAGPEAQAGFLANIAEGLFRVACLETREYQTVISLSERYRAFQPGLADLSIVVLAARLDTRRILTFDQRHFRAMTPLQGGAFTLLPWDGD